MNSKCRKYKEGDLILCIGQSPNTKEELEEKFIGRLGIIEDITEYNNVMRQHYVFFKELDDCIFLYEDEMKHHSFIEEDEFMI